MFTFKILNYFDGVFTPFTLTLAVTPVTGDAVLHDSKYYVIMHKILNETNTYLVSPFFANPSA